MAEARKRIEAAQSVSDVVTVVCSMHGAVRLPNPGGDDVIIPSGPSITPNVPLAIWNAWHAENIASPMVMRGGIFAVEHDRDEA